ncbi:MAG: hypothetical protein M3R04_08145 [bacterium]|nr:hypothetical protein [bacterium]
MNWKGMAALGAAGAAVAVAYPLLKKKGLLPRSNKTSSYSPTDSGVDNLGNTATPPTETWAAGGGQ